MNLLRELLDVAPLDPNVRRTPAPEGKIRLHLFCGSFESEDDLLAYCFDAPSENDPEPLTKDLPEAFVDTTYVVTGYERGVGEALADFFTVEESDEVLAQISGKNSLVILSEHAFGGMDYSLNDTPRLRYLGARFVDLP